jgi:hypothetical protein
MIVVALAGMLALTGALAALVLLPSRWQEPFFLTLPITEYKERLYPVNFLVERDDDGLRQHFPASGQRSRAYESQEKELLLKELAALKNRKDHALVVYLSALARSKQGQVYLLPGDAHPDRPDTWLPLEDILVAVERCPTRHKLLILDARPFADPRLGVLANDVADRVQDALEKREAAGELPFLVLCSCSRGQVPLIWEEKQRSAFGYFLDEGLRGLANGYNPEHKQNQRVSVHELAEFARERVDRWAWRNRNAHQTPQLFGKADDFDLTVLEHGQPKEESTDPEPAAYPDWLRDGWRLRDHWWTDGSFRAAPRVFRQLEASLLRGEQRWRGDMGPDPERIKQTLEADLREFKRQLQQAQSVRRPEPRSLAQAVARGRQADPKVVDALKDLLAKLGELAAMKPEEAKKAQDKLLGDFLVKMKKQPHFDLAWAAFEQALADDNPTPEKIRLLDDMLVAQQSQPQYVETLALHRLAETAADGKKLPNATVYRALRAIREGERAIAGDPRALPWVRAPLETAASLRLEGEILLYKGSPPSQIVKAGQLLEEADGRYRDVNQTIQVIAEAQRRHDEAFALLPGLVGYLVHRPHLSAGEERDWFVLAEAALLMNQLLRQGQSGAAPPLEEISRQLSRLQQGIASLQRLFATAELQGLLKRIGQGDPSDYLEMQALLQSPRLSAGDRATLWKTMHELGRQLADKPQAGPPEFARASRRASFAIGSLKVVGFPRADQLEREDFRQAAAGDKTSAWEPLAEKLRVAWTVDVSEQYRQAKDVALRDRISRLLPPFDRLPGNDPTENPASQLERQALKVYYEWLAKHYDGISQKLEGAPAAGFYIEAAGDCRRFVP